MHILNVCDYEHCVNKYMLRIDNCGIGVKDVYLSTDKGLTWRKIKSNVLQIKWLVNLIQKRCPDIPGLHIAQVLRMESTALLILLMSICV